LRNEKSYKFQVSSFKLPLRDIWKEKLDKLLPFPVNVNGYMINPTQGFDKGHQHYSYLLAIYPYHTVTIEDNRQTKDLAYFAANPIDILAYQ